MADPRARGPRPGPRGSGPADAGTVARGDACDRHPLPRTRRPVAPRVAAPSRGLRREASVAARHLAARTRRRSRGQHADLGRPARRGRVRRHQPLRRGTTVAPVLMGLPRADRRPGAHAPNRRGARDPGRPVADLCDRRLDGWPGDVAPRGAPPAPARGCGRVRPCDRHAPALRRLRPHEGRRRVAGAGANRDRRHARAGACCLRRSQP